MTRRWLLLGVLFVCALVFADRARATVMVLLTSPELAARSDVIVTGTVRSVHSRVVLEADAARPYTFVEVAIEHVEKGALSHVLVLQEAGGGWVNDTHAATVGIPIYQVGQRVLVFAQRASHLPAGRYRTTAMSQGKFMLRTHPSGEVVSRDLRGLSFARPGLVGGVSLREGTVEPERPLTHLLREIRGGRP